MKRVLIASAMMLAVSACTRGETKEQSKDEAARTDVVLNEVTVRTRDFVFDLPDTIPAGATSFRLINDGPDLHHVWLVRLEEGKTVADLMQALKTAHGALPAWAVDVGGPNTPVPGEESAATLDLEAGSYALICVIPSKQDGVPHVMKGMVRGLTVVPNRKPAPLPKADLVLTLKDYSFEFDKPVKRGVQTIRVENAAQQSHEVVLIQLAPGKKVQDVMAWFANGQAGPPPGKPIGGTTGFAAGEVNVITHDFAPGNYGMICFVPDAKDGKAHVAHGMISEFTVAE